MHAALRPQEMSPPDVHLIEHPHVVAVQLEVPDLEVLLNPGGSDGLRRNIVINYIHQAVKYDIMLTMKKNAIKDGYC